jgi:hypothetical protein
MIRIGGKFNLLITKSVFLGTKLPKTGPNGWKRFQLKDTISETRDGLRLGIWAQFCKNFFLRNLRIFVIS